MAIHRYDGASWVPGSALYRMHEPNVYNGGPAIWVRARMVWSRTAGGWQSASAGSAPVADLTAVARTTARSVNGGDEILDPVTGDPNIYWESSVQVAAGAGCSAIAVWYRNSTDQPVLWRFHHSEAIQPNGSKRVAIESTSREILLWCVTAWGPGSVTPTALPTGQQGYSRFVSP